MTLPQLFNWVFVLGADSLMYTASGDSELRVDWENENKNWRSESLCQCGGIIWAALPRPGASRVAQMVTNLPVMQETRVRFLGWEDPLKEMATHSSTLAWRISWKEDPAGYSPQGHKELDMTEWYHNTKVNLRQCSGEVIWGGCVYFQNPFFFWRRCTLLSHRAVNWTLCAIRLWLRCQWMMA